MRSECNENMEWLLTVVALVCVYLLWRWGVGRRGKEAAPVPYKVIKAPPSEGEGGRKVVAVLGGTGFIGSHVVDELVSQGDVEVRVLGRKFKEGMVNPKADSLVQVDMTDLDGLTAAFQGVESVIDVAACIPTAYSTVDSLWRVNQEGVRNAIKAAQVAGVKNFVWVSGLHFQGMPKEAVGRAFFEVFYWGENHVLEADGKEGMHTCVVSLAQVVGLRMNFWKMAVEGKANSFPMLEHRATFLPVEYAAKAVVSAEQKLAAGAAGVRGERLPIVGEVLSLKKFLSLPTWPHKFTNISMSTLQAMAWLNVLLARGFGWAPMGHEVSPALLSMFSLAEEEVDGSSTYELLEIPPPPSMEGYVKEMAEKCEEKGTT